MYDAERAQLQRIVDSENDVVYCFLATSRGRLLCEVGSKNGLPHSGVVDLAMEPTSIRSSYRECVRHAKEDPGMIPRMHGQGRTQGVIGPCSKALLVAIFGVMSEEIYSSSPEARAKWLSSFRKRIWTKVVMVFG